jgi:DNA-binding transcriptional ArsR family regulator
MSDQPSAGAFQPAPKLRITTLETLKVFSDPLRQQIIEVLLDDSKTVKQIAAELDLAPTKLYYHVNLLEEHGLIRVTETRIVSGIIEKHYQSAARGFEINRPLLTPGQNSGDDAIDAAIDAMIEPIRGDIHKAFKQGAIDMSDESAPHQRLRMWRATSGLTSEQAAEFYRRLEALIAEFNAFREVNADEPQWGLIIGIHPVAPKAKKT